MFSLVCGCLCSLYVQGIINTLQGSCLPPTPHSIDQINQVAVKVFLEGALWPKPTAGKPLGHRSHAISSSVSWLLWPPAWRWCPASQFTGTPSLPPVRGYARPYLAQPTQGSLHWTKWSQTPSEHKKERAFCLKYLSVWSQWLFKGYHFGAYASDSLGV